MTTRSRTLIAALALAALLVLLLVVAERVLALAERLAGLPDWMQWLVAAVLALFALAAAWLAWLWLRPRAKPAVEPIDRVSIDARIDQLERGGIDTAPLREELGELDSRRDDGQLYVALFGEISSGKSSLVEALVPGTEADTDVVGGSTREVAHFDGKLPGGRRVRLADVPGSRESGGEAREALARDEALRAHAVVYVAAGDLSRKQMQELRWLGEFGKPLLLVLNKADQWREDERRVLLGKLRRSTSDLADAVVTTRAGGSERFRRELPDGRTETVERSRLPDIEAMQKALERITSPGADALEDARERAVLAGLHQRTGTMETEQREAESRRVVAKYTRRAILGAMAAVAPGSDLVIQGALAAAMARELGKVHGVAVSDLAVDDFLKQARVNLRTSASVVLAIAGNALKAFPGLGTLSGGVLHAFAYALIFDSLGKALAVTLAERHGLDADAAGQHLRELLADGNSQRLRRLAALTVDAVRQRDGSPNHRRIGVGKG